jgi:hypothetical protein
MIPLVVICWVGYSTTSSHLLRNNGLLLQSMAQQMLGKIHRNLSEHNGDVQSLAFNLAGLGGAEIAQNITAVANATLGTTEVASNSQKAAVELSHMAGDLQQLVGRFRFHRNSLEENRSSFGAPVNFADGIGTYQSA